MALGMPLKKRACRVPFQSECAGESVRYVLEFFLKSPKAADTAEGITRWRLLQVTVHHALNDTRKAVQFLVEKGYLKQSPAVGSDADDLFSLDENHRAAAEKFLRDLA